MAWKQTAKYQIALVFLALSVLLIPVSVFAAQSSSNNYQVNEVFFGSGGELHACSTAYCSKQSAGELAVGTTASNSYKAQAGFNTDRTPYIEFTVSNTNVNLGTLNATTTKTATATFSVKAYLAHGYNVVNASGPPTNNSYSMQALATPTASSVGTEQFGINLVANTVPSIPGSADPTFSPDASFSFGQVAPDYSTTNLFKYAVNDTVAFSTASTSFTTYTVSYLFNVSHVTPGGVYSLLHVLVATGTY